MDTSIVIGLGETGGPLRKVLGCDGYDAKIGNTTKEQYDIVHICIPFSPTFNSTVTWYQTKYKPKLTIIHSTVPIGTTSKLKDAVHSPILGKHDNMEQSIRSFPKWVGGEEAFAAAEYFRDHGLEAVEVPTSEETEALKLMCLMKYGVDIATAQYRKEVADMLDFPYEDVLLWDEFYNKYVGENLKRSLLTPPGDTIGGHCVLQNMPFMKIFRESPLIDEILKFKAV